jgi:hypothetical protein
MECSIAGVSVVSVETCVTARGVSVGKESVCMMAVVSVAVVAGSPRAPGVADVQEELIIKMTARNRKPKNRLFINSPSD